MTRSCLFDGRDSFASLEYTFSGAPGLGLTEGLIEGELEDEAEWLGDLDIELLTDEETLCEGDGEREGLLLGVADALGDIEELTLGDGERLIEGETDEL